MIGILCGLKSEAACFQQSAKVQVFCSGAHREQAYAGARKLVESGAKILASVGIAGGLSPDLHAGDIVVADTVANSCATFTSSLAETYTNLLAKDESLAASGARIFRGAVWGSDTLIAESKEKQALWEKGSFLAADMESHIVAEVAEKAGLPFFVLRVVTDTHDMGLPAAARVPLRADGGLDAGGIAKAILTHLGQIPALIQLAGNTNKAMASLARAAGVITR